MKYKNVKIPEPIWKVFAEVFAHSHLSEDVDKLITKWLVEKLRYISFTYKFDAKQIDEQLMEYEDNRND